MSNVLITGCSTGFGLLSAVTFASRGHHVVATMRDPGKAGALHAAAEDAGTSVTVLPLDVTDSTSVNAAVAATAALGTIDIVVNNAGIEVFGPVHLLADDEMLRQFDTNLFGVVRVCRAVMPYMLDNGGGTIVNVGSLAGLVGYPYSGIYSASKHAIEAISESMHFELSQRGIRVRVVEPGQFATELGQNSCTARGMEEGGPDHLRMLRFRTALRGLVNGQPAPAQEVADAIYAAATETPGRLRHPVGADADLVLATKRVMTFEEFDTTMRSALQWFD